MFALVLKSADGQCQLSIHFISPNNNNNNNNNNSNNSNSNININNNNNNNNIYYYLSTDTLLIGQTKSKQP